MIDEILSETEQHMATALQAMQRDLAGIRTGRATTSLLDGVRVDYYGTATPLNQLSTVSAPEPRLLMIKPYEASIIGEIEKTIRADATLGLNPSNDGQVIRLPIPELTEERRIDLTKVARHRAEEGRVAVRHARRDSLDLIDEAQKGGEVSEDESRGAHDRIQIITDDFVKRIDEIIKSKEAEILEV
ncbi:MAG TPA: ribosome recycling factor [Candidatus Latescibacteria bacterium]|jgi:ribosome recycling factor|nr:ribosome recycling factor [Gemmatimonadaceae bacterium]MDP6017448.1 ribosome recycling factor [Candidatus Latescibacterota bacterium]HJP33763.1 ribosome recycling factor [Candidatus Latescibacterota bacterium]